MSLLVSIRCHFLCFWVHYAGPKRVTSDRVKNIALLVCLVDMYGSRIGRGGSTSRHARLFSSPRLSNKPARPPSRCCRGNKMVPGAQATNSQTSAFRDSGITKTKNGESDLTMRLIIIRGCSSIINTKTSAWYTRVVQLLTCQSGHRPCITA